MQFCKTCKKIIFSSCAILLASCASNSKKEFQPIQTKLSYKEAYLVIKKHTEKCFPGATLKTNLYSELGEAEIIMEYLPEGSMYFVGTTAVMTHESAQQIVNIKMSGEKSAQIFSKTELSEKIVQSAFGDKSCPKP